MNRIDERFKELQDKHQKALVAFVTAGDPDLPTTRRLFPVLEKSGVDIVELGVPFSDPLADGPVIQNASLRALKSGTNLKKIIQLVSDIRRESQLPIVLMASYNPVFVYGPEKFAEDAVRAGVDGVIIPDLPPEEADEFWCHADRKGLSMIFLLAPTSTEERVRMVSEKSRGFIYYVSLTGTTGMQASLSDGLVRKVGAIKKSSRIPVLIGFGISSPDQAREAAECSDGVIVGSALVRLIEQTPDPAEREQKIGEFIAGIKHALIGRT